MSTLTTVWSRSLSNGVLAIPGPFRMLTPETLLLLGIGGSGIACALLGITLINRQFGPGNVEMNSRARYIFALSVGATGMGALHRYPLLTDAYAYLSFIIWLLLPAVVSIVIVSALVRVDV